MEDDNGHEVINNKEEKDDYISFFKGASREMLVQFALWYGSSYDTYHSIIPSEMHSNIFKKMYLANNLKVVSMKGGWMYLIFLHQENTTNGNVKNMIHIVKVRVNTTTDKVWVASRTNINVNQVDSIFSVIQELTHKTDKKQEVKKEEESDFEILEWYKQNGIAQEEKVDEFHFS